MSHIRFRDLAGLDETFLELTVDELQDGETVIIFGCNDDEELMDFLLYECDLTIDMERDGKNLILTPIKL